MRKRFRELEPSGSISFVDSFGLSCPTVSETPGRLRPVSQTPERPEAASSRSPSQGESVLTQELP